MMAAHCVAIAQTSDFLPGVCLLVVSQNVLSDPSVDGNYGIHLRTLPVIFIAQ